MLDTILGLIFISARILMLGLERIFLKFLEDHDSASVTSLFFLVASLFLLPVFLVVPVGDLPLSPLQILLTLLSASLYSLGFFSYVKAISLGDTSLVAPLYNSSILWLFVLGSFILGEHVTFLRIMGGLLMFLGLLLLYPGTLCEKLRGIRSSPSSLYMITGSLFIAIGRTIDTFLTTSDNYRVNQGYYAWLINFSIGVLILLWVILRHRFSSVLKVIHEKPTALIMASLVNGWSYLMLLLAIKYLQVTFAEPASLLSVFVTALFAKTILKEEVETRIKGMIVMFFGAVLLTSSLF